jgi:microcystin-dependent protein
MFLDTTQSYNLVLTKADGTTVLQTFAEVSSAATAAQLAAIVAGLSGTYLPLSGGGVTGNLTVAGITSTHNIAAVGTLSVSGTVTTGDLTASTVTGTLDANSHTITHVATPVASTDAVNKAYVDGAAAVIPAGTIAYFAGAAAPSGWLIADGASLLTATYTNLSAVCLPVYGGADSTHFYLPDLRGTFIRGLDSGRGLDPARGLASNQACAVQVHKHNSAWGEAGAGPFGQTSGTGYTGSNATDADNYQWWTNDGSNAGGTVNAAGVVGAETRPVNIALIGIIKT